MPVCVFDSKKKLYALYGKWTECLYYVDAAVFEAYKKNYKRGAEEKKVGTELPTVLLSSMTLET